MRKHPEVTVSAIIQNSNGDILLCKSAKWNNQYVIPGGHVEYGETLEAALLREVREETGLEVTDLRLVSLQESIGQANFHELRHMIFIDFYCRTEATEVLLNEEADEYVWVAPDQLLSYDLGGFLRELFTEWLNKNASHSHPVLYGYVR